MSDTETINAEAAGLEPGKESARSMFRLNRAQFALLWKLFWRNNWLMFTASYVKLQGLTYAWVMEPFLAKIYGRGTDDYYEALERHTAFFNTTPFVSGFVQAISISMEQENKIAKDKGLEFDTTSISTIKTALMGPLAGIGDAINLSVIRVIATGIALGFSAQGSILGPILFFLGVFVPTLLIRWFTPIIGLKAGGNFIATAMKSGIFGAITKGATVLGLIMTGGMVAQYVTFKTTLVYTTKGGVFDLQKVFDSILPGLLPLSLTLICFAYLRKHNKPIRVILVLFALALVLTLLHVTGGK
ncbi:PTS system, mannose-specific IID component [Propionibacterium cyclohexanicum]|uniref:PTS system, mannose-specific IID component n=1 Tax=Propionibacterium cyclohexanicum TaxID=64702 RepID=A0A1H9U821_9ACTN|nr:PTS system mannose/fructose/sorbose family transporter subunit IID [Propionibacterium cyclohexanicum]SES05253.1 PTS system, mannose-specific IID component [Propionibacterium cyclohexanicum]